MVQGCQTPMAQGRLALFAAKNSPLVDSALGLSKAALALDPNQTTHSTPWPSRSFDRRIIPAHYKQPTDFAVAHRSPRRQVA